VNPAQLGFAVDVAVRPPNVELVDFARSEQLSGPRRNPHAATADLRHLDDPAGALHPRRCECDRPLVSGDLDTLTRRCFKCGRRA
jgi:hypothetical protein